MPEAKLREKLNPRYAADDVEAAVLRLRELRLIDDDAWAERYVRDRFVRLGKGRHRIRAELLKQGVAAATAEAAIARAVPEDSERRRAETVLAELVAREGRSSRGSRSLAAPGEPPGTTANARSRGPSGNPALAARMEAQKLKNRLFRRMLARGFPSALVRDLLDVS